jgi:glycosyltransferase involved in cell wall biosynthesis
LKPLKRETVVIVRNAYGWQYGGAEQFSLNLAVALQKNAVDSVVVSNVPNLLRKCGALNIKFHRNIWLRNETHRRWAPIYYLLYPLLIAQYVFIIKKYHGSVILLSSRDDQIFGTIAAKLVGIPSVWIDHVDMKGVIVEPFRFLRKRYFRSLAGTNAVVSVSKSERDLVFANLPDIYKDKFVVINNGANISCVDPIPRPKGKRVALFVGRIEEDKGIYDLMQAMPIVLESRRDVEFWIAGSGSAMEDLILFIKKNNLEDHVKFLGYLENVGSALMSADLFVYPTHHDSAAMANIEAMQAGLPIISTNVGGVPESVKPGCGILIDPKSPRVLASSIVNILENDVLRERMSAAAAIQGREMDFTKIVREKYIPLFSKVTAR